MDVSRNDMLGELANDAALERTDFVVQATEQLAKFLDRHRERFQGNHRMSRAVRGLDRLKDLGELVEQEDARGNRAP